MKLNNSASRNGSGLCDINQTPDVPAKRETRKTRRMLSEQVEVIESPIHSASELRTWLMDFERKNRAHYEAHRESYENTSNGRENKKRYEKRLVKELSLVMSRKTAEDAAHNYLRVLSDRAEVLEAPIDSVSDRVRWLAEFGRKNKEHSEQYDPSKKPILSSAKADARRTRQNRTRGGDKHGVFDRTDSSEMNIADKSVAIATKSSLSEGSFVPSVGQSIASSKINGQAGEEEVTSYTRRINERAEEISAPHQPVSELKSWLVDFGRKNKEHYDGRYSPSSHDISTAFRGVRPKSDSGDGKRVQDQGFYPEHDVEARTISSSPYSDPVTHEQHAIEATSDEKGIETGLVEVETGESVIMESRCDEHEDREENSIEKESVDVDSIEKESVDVDSKVVTGPALNELQEEGLTSKSEEDSCEERKIVSVTEMSPGLEAEQSLNRVESTHSFDGVLTSTTEEKRDIDMQTDQSSHLAEAFDPPDGADERGNNVIETDKRGVRSNSLKGDQSIHQVVGCHLNENTSSLDFHLSHNAEEENVGYSLSKEKRTLDPPYRVMRKSDEEKHTSDEDRDDFPSQQLNAGGKKVDGEASYQFGSVVDPPPKMQKSKGLKGLLKKLRCAAYPLQAFKGGQHLSEDNAGDAVDVGIRRKKSSDGLEDKCGDCRFLPEEQVLTMASSGDDQYVTCDEGMKSPAMSTLGLRGAGEVKSDGITLLNTAIEGASVFSSHRDRNSSRVSTAYGANCIKEQAQCIQGQDDRHSVTRVEQAFEASNHMQPRSDNFGKDSGSDTEHGGISSRVIVAADGTKSVEQAQCTQGQDIHFPDIARAEQTSDASRRTQPPSGNFGKGTGLNADLIPVHRQWDESSVMSMDSQLETDQQPYSRHISLADFDPKGECCSLNHVKWLQTAFSVEQP